MSFAVNNNQQLYLTEHEKRFLENLGQKFLPKRYSQLSTKKIFLFCTAI